MSKWQKHRSFWVSGSHSAKRWIFEKLITLSPMSKFSQTQHDFEEDVELMSAVADPFQLIVWNDEVNTFEWVIETLIDICRHSHEQAEQCAYLIHYKGKYSVKQGSYETLQPMRDAISDRGIGATVELVAV